MSAIGTTEILVLLIVGLVVFGIPLMVILLVLMMRKPQTGSDDSMQLTQLREENQRLQEELRVSKMRGR